MPFPSTQSPPCRCSLPSQVRRGKEDSPFSLGSPLASRDPTLPYFFSLCKAKAQLGSSPELKGPFDPLSQRTEGPPRPPLHPSRTRSAVAPLRLRSTIAPRRHKMAAAGPARNGVSRAAVRGGRSSAGLGGKWRNCGGRAAGPEARAGPPAPHSSDSPGARCGGRGHSTFPSEQVTNKPLIINSSQQNLHEVSAKMLIQSK